MTVIWRTIISKDNHNVRVKYFTISLVKGGGGMVCVCVCVNIPGRILLCRLCSKQPFLSLFASFGPLESNFVTSYKLASFYNVWATRKDGSVLVKVNEGPCAGLCAGLWCLGTFVWNFNILSYMTKWPESLLQFNTIVFWQSCQTCQSWIKLCLFAYYI